MAPAAVRGRVPDPDQDYSSQITRFKDADAQILGGVVLPPDFTTSGKQSLQQGFNPMIATGGKALPFPQSRGSAPPRFDRRCDLR